MMANQATPATPLNSLSPVTSKFTQRAAGIRTHFVRDWWERVSKVGAIGPNSSRARRFGTFGEGALICFPNPALYNEHAMHIGAGTMIGPYCSLSVGMLPGQPLLHDRILVIGERSVIGRGSSIVAHYSVEIGNGVFTGPNIYITDQNHTFDDLTMEIGRQPTKEGSVKIGDGCWIGTGAVILPGVELGRNVVVGANAVVSKSVPDYSLVAGVPAKVIRQYRPNEGWVRVDR